MTTGGKQAIFDALEADTGKYAFSVDLGVQDVVVGIDPVTGAKKLNPKLIPGDGGTITTCPHAGGAKNWLCNDQLHAVRSSATFCFVTCFNGLKPMPSDRDAMSTIHLPGDWRGAYRSLALGDREDSPSWVQAEVRRRQ